MMSLVVIYLYAEDWKTISAKNICQTDQICSVSQIYISLSLTHTKNIWQTKYVVFHKYLCLTHTHTHTILKVCNSWNFSGYSTKSNISWKDMATRQHFKILTGSQNCYAHVHTRKQQLSMLYSCAIHTKSNVYCGILWVPKHFWSYCSFYYTCPPEF